MTLSVPEYHQYVATHMKLLYYTGIEQKLIPPAITWEAFLKLPFQRKYQCREALYKNIYVLDNYLLEKARELGKEEIDILEGFKRRVQSDFIILKCLTRYAIFIDSKTDAIYTVKALADPFDSFFQRFPVYCNTTIIPFNGSIIYDGFISTPGNICLGSGISASMNDLYLQTKKNKAIITTL